MSILSTPYATEIRQLKHVWQEADRESLTPFLSHAVTSVGSTSNHTQAVDLSDTPMRSTEHAATVADVGDDTGSSERDDGVDMDTTDGEEVADVAVRGDIYDFSVTDDREDERVQDSMADASIPIVDITRDNHSTNQQVPAAPAPITRTRSKTVSKKSSTRTIVRNGKSTSERRRKHSRRQRVRSPDLADDQALRQERNPVEETGLERRASVNWAEVFRGGLPLFWIRNLVRGREVKYYILECRQHAVHDDYSRNTKNSPFIKHYREFHRASLAPSRRNVLQSHILYDAFGVDVVDCDADRQEKNSKALSSRHPLAQRPCLLQPLPDFVTDPEPGRVYIGRAKSNWRGWILRAVRVLEFSGTNVDAVRKHKLLECDPPACYLWDEGEGRVSWAPGFGSGEPLCEERYFPVFTANYNQERSGHSFWMAAKNLMEFSEDAAKGMAEVQVKMARRWIADQKKAVEPNPDSDDPQPPEAQNMEVKLFARFARSPTVTAAPVTRSATALPADEAIIESEFVAEVLETTEPGDIEMLDVSAPGQAHSASPARGSASRSRNVAPVARMH